MYYFYVLQSLKKPEYFYKGSTSDLKNRFKEHNNGETKSNKPYAPFRLVYYEAYLSKKAAITREMSVKKSGSIWIPLRKRILKSLES